MPMILFTEMLIKIALALACMAAGTLCLMGKRNRQPKGKKSKIKTGQRMERSAVFCRCILWIVLAVAFAAAANAVAGLVPPLKDVVVLTALGEKNEAASGEEVFFKGFTVDGKTVPVSNPAEGKWFWKGDDTLCWRIESDPRQPEGVTRSVTVQVPVGLSRTANFAAGVQHGMVEVEIADSSQVIDTYAESDTVKTVVLGRSDTARLILNQARYLAAYAAVLAALGALAWWLFRLALADLEKAKAWALEHCGQLICGGIALAAFAVMLRYANVQSLWEDELLTIDFTNGTIIGAIRYCYQFGDAHPPLFHIIATLWYHIAPYGERWLLLMNMIPCAVTVYVVGRIGELVKNRRLGVLMSVLMATSVVMMRKQAFEYRSYAFFLTFFTLTMYCFIRRNREPERKKWHILYSLFLLCMGMTDYYGMVVCGEFFVADAYLVVRGRNNKKAVLDYLVPGAVCAAWMVFFLIKLSHRNNVLAFWFMPTLSDVRNVLRMLCSNIEPLYWLLIIGIGIGLAGMFFKKDGDFPWDRFYMAICALMVVVTITVPIFIAKIFRMEAAVWADRYFAFLLPCAFLLISNVLLLIMEKIGLGVSYVGCGLTVGLGMLLLVNCILSISSSKPITGGISEATDPYRESADWIYEQDDIFDESTVIIVDDWLATTVGYQEYYISRQGMRDELNVVSGWMLKAEDLAGYDRVYLLYCHCGSQSVRNSFSYIEDQFDLVTDRTAERVLVYSRK